LNRLTPRPRSANFLLKQDHGSADFAGPCRISKKRSSLLGAKADQPEIADFRKVESYLIATRHAQIFQDVRTRFFE
jgi:hypothetical protein